MRAITECLWPVTNTFVTSNGKIGFSLKEIKEVTSLSILGELYEKYFPEEVELAVEADSEL